MEAGLRAFGSDGGSNTTVLFWADVRPGFGYADHYGPVVNTLYGTCCVDIEIWKAGTIPNVDWCPSAASEWCVYLYSETDGQEVTDISGEGNSNTMTVSSYREGMELYGTSGAVANNMHFTYNTYEDIHDNSWNFQFNKGDITKYVSNPPVEDYWADDPAGDSNYGGDWLTCISGSGCF